jgi:hypothetical protein
VGLDTLLALKLLLYMNIFAVVIYSWKISNWQPITLNLYNNDYPKDIFKNGAVVPTKPCDFASGALIYRYSSGLIGIASYSGCTMYITGKKLQITLFNLI